MPKKPDHLSLLEYIDTPIASINGSGSFFYCNQAFEETLGYSFEELKEMNFFDFIEPSKSNCIKSVFKNSLIGQFVTETDLNLKRKSGRKLIINLSITESKHNPKTFHLTIVDQTKTKKIEAQKEEMLKLASHQSKMADLGELSAGISHELNNPLAIILGYANLINSLTENSDVDSQIKEIIEKIVPAAKRMETIIYSMRQFSRMDKNTFENQKLDDLVEDTLSLIKFNALSKNIEVKTQLRPLKANINGSQIQQIIMNIFNNAVQAYDEEMLEKEGNYISIETLENSKDRTVSLKITNNGPKIPAHIIDKVFNPFFTTKEPGKGTGLGLSLAYDFMRSHRGSLKVTSDDTKTSFELIFPHISQFQTSDDATKILIVDDEQDIRAILSTRLAIDNHFTIEAKDGVDALQMLAKHHFDFLITDLKMPRLDGFNLIKEVRSRSPLTKVIAFSAYATSDDFKTEAHRLSADVFFSKSDTIENICEFIDKSNEPKKKAA